MSLTRSPMSDELLLRYSRQIMLQDFDIDGQEALRNSQVLIIGLGGLGSPAALYLAAAGCGELILADHDAVDLSNLQRQVVHRQESLGLNKAQSAAQALAALNPDVKVCVQEERLAGENLQQAVAKVDVVVDCTDNFATRDAINRACLVAKVPLISGAAIRAEGQLTVFDFRNPESPCYQCLYGAFGGDDATCSQTGVLAPVVGMIGTTQALEAIKILTGYGETAVGRLLALDARTLSWREFRYRRDPGCEVCGQR